MENKKENKRIVVMADPTESCCDCVSNFTPSITTAQAEETAKLFAALADSTRLTILSMLGAAEMGEVCVCDITSSFNLGQPTISHHLRILRDAGLVRGDKRGKWVYYSLVKDKIEEAQKLLTSINNKNVLV